MTVHLVDANVLIALVVAEHVHHAPATEWFDSPGIDLATCPVTEGALLRFLLREGRSASESVGVLEQVRAQPWHRFWPDDLPYDREQLAGVIGHRQVTDAHLVALARRHRSRLVTFDRGLSVLHRDDVLLLDA